MPLETGNTWTLTVADGFIEKVEFRVGGNTTINNDAYREIDIIATTSNMMTLTRTYVAREQSGGVYIARPDTTEAGIQLYGFELRSPDATNGAYAYTDERGHVYDVSISEQTLTVEEGMFEVLAYRVVRQLNGNTDTAFIAPGIGPVQLDFRGESYRLESTNVE